MKPILKQICIIIHFAVLVIFFGGGFCHAEEALDTPVAPPAAEPIGVIGTSHPIFVWEAAPGASKYCLLVVSDAGIPFFYGEYAAEEVKCSGEENMYEVAPRALFRAGRWAILSCTDDACGSWSSFALLNVPNHDQSGKSSRASEPNACYQQCIEPIVACQDVCRMLFDDGEINRVGMLSCFRTCPGSAGDCARKCYTQQ